MAGDRGLAFVVIGLIGVSAFWVSNERRIQPRPAQVRASQIDSAENAVSLNPHDGTWYVFRRGDRSHGGAATLGYPELSAPAADTFSRFAERLRLSPDTEIASPID